MSNANENSALIALRELREIERRRSHEEQQARAALDRQQREQKAAQARRTREARAQTEWESATAAARAEAERLGRELESARAEIVQLRSQVLAQASVAEAARPVGARSSRRLRAVAWLAISAGTMMLVGGLALSAGKRPTHGRPPKVETFPREPAAACPAVKSTETTRPPPTDSPRGVREAPILRKRSPKSRPSSSRRPGNRAKPGAGKVECDGTDPLCGIDPRVVDDIGWKRAKPGKR